MSTDKKEILVLGAGVSGISSGISLLKAGYAVTTWAKEFTPYTTSDVAAAFWYPYLCNPKDKAVEWSRFTFQYLKHNVINDPESGCVMRTMTELFDKKMGNPWWKDAVESYGHVSWDDLPHGYTDGYQIEAPLLDTSKYMRWLLKKYTEMGGTIEKHFIESIDETPASYDVIVNCTGLGSIKLFNDDSLYPVRGQVVLVKPNVLKQIIADDEAHNKLAYIIPRENDIVLGGTAQANNWSLEIDPNDTADILRKAKLLSPAFNKVDILGIKVGLRPARDEIRLEVEHFADKHVIHNYGHGGAGFTLSWGCANEVVKLIKQI